MCVAEFHHIVPSSCTHLNFRLLLNLVQDLLLHLLVVQLDAGAGAAAAVCRNARLACMTASARCAAAVAVLTILEGRQYMVRGGRMGK